MNFLKNTGIMQKLNCYFRTAKKRLFDYFLENNKYLEYPTCFEIKAREEKEREEEKERKEKQIQDYRNEVNNNEQLSIMGYIFR